MNRDETEIGTCSSGGYFVPDNLVEKIKRSFDLRERIFSNIGITINSLEVYKKYSFKKYGKRYNYRWLSRRDKQKALLDRVLEN